MVRFSQFYVRLLLGETMDLVDDDLGIDRGMSHAQFNRLLNPFEGMLSQQLQDAYILSGSGKRSFTSLKPFSKFGKTDRKLPSYETRPSDLEQPGGAPAPPDNAAARGSADVAHSSVCDKRSAYQRPQS